MESLCDVANKLEIVVQDVGEERRRYKISCESYPLYRNILEEYRLTVWKDCEVAPNLGWTRISEPSLWLEQLSEEPLLKLHHPNLVHYVIVTEDDVIDVLADSEPKIEELGIVDESQPIPGKSIIYFKKGEPIH